jgi:protein-tyrosine phosphatase
MGKNSERKQRVKDFYKKVKHPKVKLIVPNKIRLTRGIGGTIFVSCAGGIVRYRSGLLMCSWAILSLSCERRKGLNHA